MKPLPLSAKPDDPRWSVEFLELAHGLVEYGARLVVIKRYTDLAKNRITALYVALRQDKPAPGALMQGEARFFAIPTRYTSASWVLQGAIFLECYDRMRRIAGYTINQGWLLLHSYKAYLRQTQKLVEAVPQTKRLDINQAYALLSRVGFLDPKMLELSELQRQPCVTCGVNYLVVTNEEQDHQCCPVCLVNQNASRLADQSAMGGTNRSAARATTTGKANKRAAA